MKIKHINLVQRIDRVINKFIFLEKKRKFSFNGTDLYASELHLMFTVYDERSANVTRISEVLGVTKGAVSQTISRLENKGILLKSKDPYAKNELTVSFTPLGKKAAGHFIEVKTRMHKKYDNYLATLTAKEQDIIKRFLIYLEEI